MRIYAFVGHYPAPYKPYYDTQFADFLRAGHELRIMAAPALDDTINEKVVRNRLAERTSYYPESGRQVSARTLGRLMAKPLPAVRYMRTATTSGPRRAAVELLSMAGLPNGAPDAAIVHELAVGLRFYRLGSWFHGVPVGLYYHGGEVASVQPHEPEFVAHVFGHFDVVFTNTEFSRQHAIDRGCPPEKVEVLPVGFDLNDYRPPANRVYRRDGILQLLSAGRMSEEKGFDYALEAVRLVIESGRRNIRYSLTGEGYVRESLERYVRRHGLEDHVRFVGRLTTEQVITAMGNADALVLSSVTVGNWTENQACAVQEAMLMKALVVTTRTGGVPESIPPSMKRFTAGERNAAELARAIMEVYDLTNGELANLGNSGRQFVEQHYDIRQLNRAMLAKLTGRAVES